MTDRAKRNSFRGFKAAEHEDKLVLNTRKRSSLKYGSTLSLGSNAVKESLRSVIVQKTRRTFGVELSTLLAREKEFLPEQSARQHSVPRIVTQIVEYLKEHSIDTPGLFRVPGKHSEIMSATTAIDDGQEITFNYLTQFDTHTVADLLKKYLRELPRPIVPVEKYFSAFMAAANMKNEEEMIKYVASLVGALPADNLALLKYLCKFFWCLAQYSEETKMGASNISIIFSPLFFGQSDSINSAHLILEAKSTSKLAKSMIDNYDSIFVGSQEAAKFMMAYESIANSEFSLIKGEEVAVCYIGANGDEEELCFVHINGRIFKISRVLVESKCKPQPEGDVRFDGIDKTAIDEIRAETIQRLLTDDKTAKQVKAADPLAVRNLKPVKKSKSRRKSDSLRGFIKQPSSSSNNNSPASTRNRSGSFHESLSPKKTDKKEKKDKKQKKEKEKKKKINSTISAWYGAPANKSSNSFFGAKKK